MDEPRCVQVANELMPTAVRIAQLVQASIEERRDEPDPKLYGSADGTRLSVRPSSPLYSGD